MTTTSTEKYNVGGVLLDRPFKIRRLGHIGFNASKIEENKHFYVDLLGFRISDLAGVGFFARFGNDHHALVMFDRKAVDQRVLAGPRAHHWRAENDVNQISWQVSSVQEIWDATKYFKGLESEIIMEGRGGAGSNYHLYVYDPDDQIDELFAGMEQIGWTGYAKPNSMHHSLAEAADGPMPSEFEEVQGDLANGVDMLSGYRYQDLPGKYDVDGVLLPRPFKVTSLGPMKIFVDNVEISRDYYQDVMGLRVTEEVTWQGEKCYFLRCDTEHHSLGLFPKAMREKLGFKPDSSCMSVGLQVANYRQLKDSIGFLRENGVRVETDLVPSELHPGIDYAAYAFDPEGHVVELYYYMEQLGWDGQPRPQALRRKVEPNNWPDELDPISDTFNGHPYMGPWG